MAGCCGIDLELCAQRVAAVVIALSEDAFMVGIRALPGNYEAAVVGHAKSGKFLVAVGGGIDLELPAIVVTGRIEALAPDASSVGIVTLPGDDEAAVCRHREAR